MYNPVKFGNAASIFGKLLTAQRPQEQQEQPSNGFQKPENLNVLSSDRFDSFLDDDFAGLLQDAADFFGDPTLAQGGHNSTGANASATSAADIAALDAALNRGLNASIENVSVNVSSSPLLVTEAQAGVPYTITPELPEGFQVDSIPSQPDNGRAVLNSDGSITYTANTGFNGLENISFLTVNPNGDSNSGPSQELTGAAEGQIQNAVTGVTGALLNVIQGTQEAAEAAAAALTQGLKDLVTAAASTGAQIAQVLDINAGQLEQIDNLGKNATAQSIGGPVADNLVKEGAEEIVIAKKDLKIAAGSSMPGLAPPASAALAAYIPGYYG